MARPTWIRVLWIFTLTASTLRVDAATDPGLAQRELYAAEAIIGLSPALQAFCSLYIPAPILVTDTVTPTAVVTQPLGTTTVTPPAVTSTVVDAEVGEPVTATSTTFSQLDAFVTSVSLPLLLTFGTPFRVTRLDIQQTIYDTVTVTDPISTTDATVQVVATFTGVDTTMTGLDYTVCPLPSSLTIELTGCLLQGHNDDDGELGRTLPGLRRPC